jgi:hypothetical protein
VGNALRAVLMVVVLLLVVVVMHLRCFFLLLLQLNSREQYAHIFHLFISLSCPCSSAPAGADDLSCLVSLECTPWRAFSGEALD